MPLTPLISESITSTKHLQFVSFSMMNDWSIYSILGEKVGYNNSYSLEKIGKFLIRNKTTVLVADTIEYKRPTIKMNNKGVQLRDIEIGKNIGTKKQFRVTKGQFLLSKIDARNGAFGVVYDDCDNSIITGNFWTFDVDYSLIIPEYLNLVTSTKKFHELCQSASVGTTGRHYLRESSFLDTKIPLPDLTTQSRIVREYQDRISEAVRLEQLASEGEKEIESYLIDALGITIENTEKKQGINFVRFRDINTWSLDDICGNYGLSSSKYKIVKLDKTHYIERASRGKSPKYKDNTGALILNQKCNRWDMIDLQYAKSVDKQWFDSVNATIKTQLGDIIINSTGEGTLGRSSLVREGFEGLLYDSHMLLLRVDQRYLNPEFIVKQINSPFFQKQIDSIKSATSTNQTELGVDNLLNLNFVIPESIDFQNEIVTHIESIKSTIATARTESERLRNEAKESFERELFA